MYVFNVLVLAHVFLCVRVRWYTFACMRVTYAAVMRMCICMSVCTRACISWHLNIALLCFNKLSVTVTVTVTYVHVCLSHNLYAWVTLCVYSARAHTYSCVRLLRQDMCIAHLNVQVTRLHAHMKQCECTHEAMRMHT